MRVESLDPKISAYTTYLTIFQNSMRRNSISTSFFNNLCEKFIHMRIVEDKDGERFLVIESDEDFEKFKEDLLKTAREKAKDRARKGDSGLLCEL